MTDICIKFLETTGVERGEGPKGALLCRAAIINAVRGHARFGRINSAQDPRTSIYHPRIGSACAGHASELDILFPEARSAKRKRERQRERRR